MIAEEFVKAFYREKENSVKEYFSEASDTEVTRLIKALKLDEKQMEELEKIMHTSFEDVLFTILFGLEGRVPIGGVKERYKLQDQKGNVLSGEIADYACKYFNEE